MGCSYLRTRASPHCWDTQLHCPRSPGWDTVRVTVTAPVWCLPAEWASRAHPDKQAQAHGTAAQELVPHGQAFTNLSPPKISSHRDASRCQGRVGLRQGLAANCIFSARGWTLATTQSRAQSWGAFPEASRARSMDGGWPARTPGSTRALPKTVNRAPLLGF